MCALWSSTPPGTWQLVRNIEFGSHPRSAGAEPALEGSQVVYAQQGLKSTSNTGSQNSLEPPGNSMRTCYKCRSPGPTLEPRADTGQTESVVQTLLRRFLA